MKIKINFEDKVITYKKPILLPVQNIIQNTFSRMTLKDENNIFINTIDIYSLPGYYRTTLDIKKLVINRFFTKQLFNLENIIFDLPYFNSTIDSTSLDGEILFDIESALFTLLQSRLDPASIVKSNHLGIDELFHTKQCVKIKITPDKLKLKEISSFLNQQSKNGTIPRLRFDGNRKFELEELILFLNDLNESVLNCIEYIEEPFKNYSDLYDFKNCYKIKIAIDESLIYFLNSLDKLPSHTPIILKPALFGISKSFELIMSAYSMGHTVIISSTYQPASTFLSLIALAHFSNSLNLSELFHGLDTLSFLPDEYQNSQVLNSLSI